MYELIQCLLLGKFEQFRDRFQSFLDQILRPSGAGAAPSREGFFQGFFLGMFGSIRSINVSRAFNNSGIEVDTDININSIHFRIDEQDTLHVGVYYDDDHDEYGRGNLSRFSFFRNGDSRRMRSYGRRSMVTNIRNFDGQLQIENREARLEPIQLRNHVEMVNEQMFGDLEDCIAEMSTGDEDRGREFFNYIKRLYSGLTGMLEDNNLFNQEAFQHGFLTGILMNFRYRMNLKSYVEIISGRGYADLILLVRGEERSFRSVPMVVELKNTSRGINVSHMAHQEAEWYASALRKNKLRMLTDANDVICVGLDMASDDPTILTRNIITDPSSPIFRRLINLAVNNEDEEEYIDERGARARLRGEEGIRTLIGEVYYGFPCTQDTHNHLSRFLLGQSFLINKLGNETPLEIRVQYNNGITVFIILADSNEGRKAIIFNIKEKGRQNENLSSGLSKLSREMLRNWNVETVVEITIRGYTHTIAHAGSPSPRRYFDDTGRNNKLSIKSFRSIQEYINEVRNRAVTIIDTSLVSQGNDQLNNIVQAFREAVLYQHGIDRGALREVVHSRLGIGQEPVTCSTQN